MIFTKFALWNSFYAQQQVSQSPQTLPHLLDNVFCDDIALLFGRRCLRIRCAEGVIIGH